VVISEQTKIIVFYVAYFTWLTLVTFLTSNEILLAYFVGGILAFYLVFLRERGDILLSVGAATAMILVNIGSFNLTNGGLSFEAYKLNEIPYYLPMAWGLTVMALRKFYFIANKAKIY